MLHNERDAPIAAIRRSQVFSEFDPNWTMAPCGDHLDLVPGSAESRKRLACGKAGSLRHQYSNGRLATRAHRFNSPTPSDTVNAIITPGVGAALRHRKGVNRRT